MMLAPKGLAWAPAGPLLFLWELVLAELVELRAQTQKGGGWGCTRHTTPPRHMQSEELKPRIPLV